jgi:hypothetical protein
MVWNLDRLIGWWKSSFALRVPIAIVIIILVHERLWRPHKILYLLDSLWVSLTLSERHYWLFAQVGLYEDFFVLRTRSAWWALIQLFIIALKGLRISNHRHVSILVFLVYFWYNSFSLNQFRRWISRLHLLWLRVTHRCILYFKKLGLFQLDLLVWVTLCRLSWCRRLLHFLLQFGVSHIESLLQNDHSWKG